MPGSALGLGESMTPTFSQQSTAQAPVSASATHQSPMAMMLVALPAVVLAGAAALIMVPWDKEVIYEPLVRDPSPTQNSGSIDAPSYTRRTIHFPAKDGTRLEAWLYRPKVHSVACLFAIPRLSCGPLHLEVHKQVKLLVC